MKKKLIKQKSKSINNTRIDLIESKINFSSKIIIPNNKYWLLLLGVLSFFISCVSTNISQNTTSKIKLTGTSNEQTFSINTKTYSNDSIIIYEIEMDTLLTKRKILRLQYYNLKWFDGQLTISFIYCDSKIQCDTTDFGIIRNGNSIIYPPSGEITGRFINRDTFWIHPPRADYFKVLEMNAFPYFINNKKEWEYDLNFGDHWSDERWMIWEGRNTSYSKYKLIGKIYYEFGNQRLECFEIKATTTIDALGKTESTFYYNQKYGFVYMSFKTINNQQITFKMI